MLHIIALMMSQKTSEKAESSPCEGRRRRGDLRSFQNVLTARRGKRLRGPIERMVQLRAATMSP